MPKIIEIGGLKFVQQPGGKLSNILGSEHASTLESNWKKMSEYFDFSDPTVLNLLLPIAGASGMLITKTNSIAFSAEVNKRWSVDIGGSTNILERGRIFIDTDPGVDFDDNFILNIYTNSDYRAENKSQSLSIPLAYRKLSAATSGLDTLFSIGGTNPFQPEDLFKIIGVPEEIHRVATIGTPNNTFDNIDNIHAIGTGLSLISEHSSEIYTQDAGNLLYFELISPAAVTLNITSELLIRG